MGPATAAILGDVLVAGHGAVVLAVLPTATTRNCAVKGDKQKNYRRRSCNV